MFVTHLALDVLEFAQHAELEPVRLPPGGAAVHEVAEGENDGEASVDVFAGEKIQKAIQSHDQMK